jgi:hypothetical protein
VSKSNGTARESSVRAAAPTGCRACAGDSPHCRGPSWFHQVGFTKLVSPKFVSPSNSQAARQPNAII